MTTEQRLTMLTDIQAEAEVRQEADRKLLAILKDEADARRSQYKSVLDQLQKVADGLVDIQSDLTKIQKQLDPPPHRRIDGFK